jgi:cyclophilin family peptidyl-prolyl cis-trans isomerase
MEAGVLWPKNSLLWVCLALCTTTCQQAPKAPALMQLQTDMGTLTIQLFAQQDSMHLAGLSSAKELCAAQLSYVQQDVCVGIDFPCTNRVFNPSSSATGASHLRGAVFLIPDTTKANRFYIVQGKPQTLLGLDALEKKNGRKYTALDRERYVKYGGAPQLDGAAQPIGVVVEGLEVIDKLAALATDTQKKPLRSVILKYVAVTEK